MPVITRFYGIIIKMFFIHSEHNPPHIHAVYGEYLGVIDIQALTMLEGDLPTKALKMVLEWTEDNQGELMKMWATQQFKVLPPLV